MTMLDYVKEQPQVFNDVLKKKAEITSDFSQIFCEQMPDQVYLVASGTSCNAAKAAAMFMEMVWKLPVTVVPPSRMTQVFGTNPLLIFISQGGKSTNMLAAAERMKGYHRIAMTGNADGKLNGMCEHYMMIPCGEETVGPKTKGYMITILTLYLMALESSKKAGILAEDEYIKYMEVLEKTAGQLEENVKRSCRWVEENEESLKSLKEIYLVGKGQSMMVAQEGALKMMETYLIPGVPFDFEEYLHGPSCSLRESTGGMYLLPMEDDEDYERMQKLVQYHRQICPAVYTTGLPSSGDERDCVLLSGGQWYTRPFEEMIPIQVMCAVIPGKLGIDGVGMQHFKALDKVLNVKYKDPKEAAAQTQPEG
ncbi:MAG: SIS domain-containing protein [Lachnospiraceae bacterium]|nr:SIS domain-containing protein [Lachnospiraceae bacterium]